jgi:hypothetical protein
MHKTEEAGTPKETTLTLEFVTGQWQKWDSENEKRIHTKDEGCIDRLMSLVGLLCSHEVHHKEEHEQFLGLGLLTYFHMFEEDGLLAK